MSTGAFLGVKTAERTTRHPSSGVFNLLSSRANLHLSYNSAGRSYCRLQNHHGYIKHHQRGMDGLPGDVGEVPMMWVKQRKGCRMSCDVGKAAEGLENELWCRWSDVRVGEWGGAYVTAHSTPLPLLHLRHRHFTYVTWRAAHAPMMMFNISMMFL